MRLSLAGLPFAVEPDGALSRPESLLLAKMDESVAGEPFVLEIVERPPWEPEDGGTLPGYGEPAAIRGASGKVRVGKTHFRAEIDPMARAGQLFREPGAKDALLVTLKVALASWLPLEGGVALHSAAVARGGEALLFFGPSGAGKSTISSLSPYPVLSDELVAVRREHDGLMVRATGFWGTFDGGEAPRGAHRVRALLELEKGSPALLTPLGVGEAFRSILRVLLVPPERTLWSAAARVAERLVAEGPVLRIRWDSANAPWELLEPLWPSHAADAAN